MSLLKRPGSRFWQYRFKVNGHPFKGSTFTTDKREAARIELQKKAEARAANPAPRQRRGATVAELGGLDVLRAQAKGVTQDQIEAIEYVWSIIGAHFHPDEHPRVMNNHDAQLAFLAANRRTPENPDGVTGQTLQKCQHAMKRGLAIAKRKGLVSHVLDEWPEVTSDPKNQERAGKLHPPEVLAAWIRALHERAVAAEHGVDRAKAKPAVLEQLAGLHKAAAVARLYYVTGLRSEEMQKLARSWVELLDEPLEVKDADGAVVARLVAVLCAPETSTKDREDREVLIDEESLATITKYAEGLADDEPCLVGTYRKAWWSACKAIGYAKRITPRDLRHCCRTYGGAFGGDQEAARHALGHSNKRISMKYDHPFMQRAVRFAGGVHAAIGAAPGCPSPGAPVAQIGDSWWAKRGSNPRHPACKAENELLEHVTSCIYCRRIVVEHLELQRNQPHGCPSEVPQVAHLHSGGVA